ncbi:hypothetical protein, partial [Pseudonocardia sp. ICBG601]|uniref:hypothetical protein n=1 Tax=Pseudonocardia sp. ICBG601 TaxID=2846759 RepID=UPI001CF64BB0
PGERGDPAAGEAGPARVPRVPRLTAGSGPLPQRNCGGTPYGPACGATNCAGARSARFGSSPQAF